MDKETISDYTANILSTQLLPEEVNQHEDQKRYVHDLYVEKTFSVLDKFIPRSKHAEFRKMLLISGAIVFGIPVLEAFMQQGFNSTLRIGVVRENWKQVKKFFADISFDSATPHPIGFDEDTQESLWDALHSPSMTLKMTNNDVYVAGACRLKGPNGRMVEIVLARTHPLDLVLNLTSTMLMNFMTGTDVYMLYPHLTLRERFLLDLTRGSEEETYPVYFHYQKFIANPRLTMYDSLSANRDFTVLPR
ncbi:hypothetical protein VNI00_018975 [Paramarasmius palmivorus]|uniref:Uncharacterized protein n=1 Tax=Paramarasmius palmivorus TaxID=297713 RepID=A0AAW0ATD2_9AGAR